MLIRERGQISRLVRAASVVRVDRRHFRKQILLNLPHLFGIPKKILGPQEEAFVSPPPPTQPIILGQLSDRGKAPVRPDALAADGDRIDRTSKRFQNG